MKGFWFTVMSTLPHTVCVKPFSESIDWDLLVTVAYYVISLIISAQYLFQKKSYFVHIPQF